MNIEQDQCTPALDLVVLACRCPAAGEHSLPASAVQPLPVRAGPA